MGNQDPAASGTGENDTRTEKGRFMDEKKTLRKPGRRAVGLLLVLMILLSMAALPGTNAIAAGTPTSLGLAAHGIMAHRDGWLYSYAGKGWTDSNGTRYSDCAGLVYSYFSDVGALGNVQGGASRQVTVNCVFNNDLTQGIPRIHGLTITVPDYYDPGSGLYGHVGIYIGNNEVCDNSDSSTNMRRTNVYNSDGSINRGWTAWHVFDNGLLYPVSGWYALDGKMVHYSNYQYDVNTTIDGYSIGSDGYARLADGSCASVNSGLLSGQYASASTVAQYLKSIGYSGVDSTAGLINGTVDRSTFKGPALMDPTPAPAPSTPTTPTTPSQDYDAQVTGSKVNLRREAKVVPGNVVTTVVKGDKLKILREVSGMSITDSASGKTSSIWYQVVTAGGAQGYICSLYVEKLAAPAPADPWSNVTSGGEPVFSCADGYVSIASPWSGASIYYTTDNTTPTKNSPIYTGAVYLTGKTFKAVAVTGGKRSQVSSATVLSNGAIFTDMSTREWYYSAVDFVVGKGLFAGTGNQLFKPSQAMTRGMFVTVLGRKSGVNTAYYQGVSQRFSDVSDSDYFAPYVEWAARLGVVNGSGDGQFFPNQEITREQMAAILYRFAASVGADMNYDASLMAAFPDAASVSPFAAEAMRWAVGNKIINGANGQLSPKASASRAQVAQVMMTCDARF